MNILDQLWQILYAIGQVFIDINRQKLKNNLAIWSHWSGVAKISPFYTVLNGSTCNKKPLFEKYAN